jgi:presenilin-like A22 family membrane protease
MPTTIKFPLSADMTQRPKTIKLHRSWTRDGYWLLTIWAVVMLSIGAAAHFGLQFGDLTALEQVALF